MLLLATMSSRLQAQSADSGLITGEMSTRDADGQLVIRAHPLPERLVIDGHLDERVYSQFQPASGFVQIEPHHSQPATEQTQLWIFFDERAIYIGLRCFDSAPERWSSLDMRRDSSGFGQGESVSVSLDTFHDRRNGFAFGINPAGGISDGAISNERDNNRDWNTIWDSRVARFDGGWSVEMAIPFSSLRYAPGEQVWGINVRRTVQWKNEMSYLNPVPLSGESSPQFGLFRFSSAATLVGLRTPPVSRLFEIKPYGISSLKTDLDADVPFSNKGTASLGVDLKVGVTRGLTADFTFNTDFAQVEDDEQQVNLTRFSLFYPEKREFFLEGQGIFAFGGFTQQGQGRPGEIPLPFLQPEDRYRRRWARRADPGWRPSHWPIWKVFVGNRRHSDETGRCVRSTLDEFLGGADSTRHPSPQQHRCDHGQPVGLRHAVVSESGLRRRRSVFILRESEHQHVRRQYAYAGVARRHGKLSGTARVRWRSLRRRS